jgi:transcriptional regulator with XRE-family HTH domain
MPIGEREEYFIEKMEQALLSRNQLSKLTGLSNSYLALLEKGDIADVKKDKLIYIAFGLGLSFEETNELLRQYGYLKIVEGDIPKFIKAAERRKIEGMQPIYKNLGIELLLISLDTLPGDEHVVNDRLSFALQPPEYAIFKKVKQGITDLVHHKITEAIVRHKRLLLDETLNDYNVKHLICENCLKGYLAKGINPEERKYIVRHVKTLLTYLEHPNYSFNLIKRCPSIRFALKYMPKEKIKENNKAFFVGQDTGHFYNPENILNHAPSLYGFATDLEYLFKYFEREFGELQKCLIPEYSNPAAMAAHIKELFKDVVGADLDQVLEDPL